jgi:hypothetical protein
MIRRQRERAEKRQDGCNGNGFDLQKFHGREGLLLLIAPEREKRLKKTPSRTARSGAPVRLTG